MKWKLDGNGQILRCRDERRKKCALNEQIPLENRSNSNCTKLRFVRQTALLNELEKSQANGSSTCSIESRREQRFGFFSSSTRVVDGSAAAFGRCVQWKHNVRAAQLSDLSFLCAKVSSTFTFSIVSLVLCVHVGHGTRSLGTACARVPVGSCVCFLKTRKQIWL